MTLPYFQVPRSVLQEQKKLDAIKVFMQSENGVTMSSFVSGREPFGKAARTTTASTKSQSMHEWKPILPLDR